MQPLLAGWHHADVVDSTNSWALRSAPGDAGIHVFLADQQTAGRGRRGRTWQSPPGANLYLTLARRWAAPAHTLGPLAVLAGLAAAEALHALGISAVRVKWPNDLVADGRKLGGLLVELQDGMLVLGLGVNVALPPDVDTGQPATDLATLGAVPRRDALLTALLGHLLPLLASPASALDANQQRRWAALDALAGQPVDVHTGTAVLPGDVIGLDGDGALRVRHADGERRHLAGEVSLRAR